MFYYLKTIININILIIKYNKFKMLEFNVIKLSCIFRGKISYNVEINF